MSKLFTAILFVSFTAIGASFITVLGAGFIAMVSTEVVANRDVNGVVDVADLGPGQAVNDADTALTLSGLTYAVNKWGQTP
jgi:hypothetical protein